MRLLTTRVSGGTPRRVSCPGPRFLVLGAGYFLPALTSAWPDYDLLARIKIMSVSPPFWGILPLFLECGSSEIA